MKTISLKVSPEQDKLIAATAVRRGFPSKSEFIRYAIARSLEEELSVETLEEVFEARRQVRQRKTVPLSGLEGK
ncbi:MAG: ribbon-helix-helix domain-containing protein [Candidatus Thermoplasmatota archaeon]|nr:ribbon-helix-helix domain-containing protein [Candidatus Thermoplasmatota archaeon]